MMQPATIALPAPVPLPPLPIQQTAPVVKQPTPSKPLLSTEPVVKETVQVWCQFLNSGFSMIRARLTAVLELCVCSYIAILTASTKTFEVPFSALTLLVG